MPLVAISQGGTSGYHTLLQGAAILSDGSFVAVGYVGTASDDYDLIAYKLSADGEYLWDWTVRSYPRPTRVGCKEYYQDVGALRRPRRGCYRANSDGVWSGDWNFQFVGGSIHFISGPFLRRVDSEASV